MELLGIVRFDLVSRHPKGSGPIDDHSADALLTAAWLRLNGEDVRLWAPPALDRRLAQTEGWTFGAR